MFALHGNAWHLASLRNVFLAGLGLELLAAVSFMLFRDDCTLDAESDAVPRSERTTAEAAHEDETEANKPKLGEEGETITATSPHIWLVPYILFASSLCFALGSGMTVKVRPNALHCRP